MNARPLVIIFFMIFQVDVLEAIISVFGSCRAFMVFAFHLIKSDKVKSHNFISIYRHDTSLWINVPPQGHELCSHFSHCTLLDGALLVLRGLEA